MEYIWGEEESGVRNQEIGVVFNSFENRYRKFRIFLIEEDVAVILGKFHSLNRVDVIQSKNSYFVLLRDWLVF